MLRRAQQVLLDANGAYIDSAATADKGRVAPLFLLQGPDRNMARIASRFDPVMTADELARWNEIPTASSLQRSPRQNSRRHAARAALRCPKISSTATLTGTSLRSANRRPRNVTGREQVASDVNE